MALYRRALAANPRSARAAYNLGLAQLCEFEFGEGWELLRAALRHHAADRGPAAPSRLPAFSRRDWGQGRRLAIWREQGIGDQLLYATLAARAAGARPGLRARGRRAPACPPSRARIRTGTVVAPGGLRAALRAVRPPLSPVASLPRLLRPTRESFARQPRALLAADPERARGLSRAPRRARRARRRHLVAQLPAQGARLPASARSPRRSRRSRRSSRRPDVRARSTCSTATPPRSAPRSRASTAGSLAAPRRPRPLQRPRRRARRHRGVRPRDHHQQRDGALRAAVLGKRALLLYLADNPPFHYWATRCRAGAASGIRRCAS